MKKSLIALAVLAASGAAMAQSSVTLYGKLDTAIGVSDFDKGDGKGSLKQTILQSGAVSGSRWGMKGSEDLGGGLKANFNLESGFNADRGSSAQGGLLFGRQAWVGLSGGFGDVQVGRVRSVMHIVTGASNGMLGANELAPLKQIGRVNSAPIDTGNTLRFNNAISYTTPKMGGFNARVQYALGENNTKGTDADTAAAFNVNYAGGPLGVELAYQVESCERGAVGTTAGIASGIGNDACSGGREDREFAFLGAHYKFGVAVLKGSYAHIENIAGLNNAKSDEYQIGVDVPLSSAFTLTASYARADDNGTQSAVVNAARATGFKTGTGDVKREGFGLGAKYVLSKRTFLYGGYEYDEETQSNARDSDHSLFAIGIQHNF